MTRQKRGKCPPGKCQGSGGLGLLPAACLPAFCPLGSSELAARCFHSLRRHPTPAIRLRPTPPRLRAGHGVGRDCHLPAPQCGSSRRRGPGGCAAAVPRRRGHAPLSCSGRYSAQSLVLSQPQRSPGLRQRQPPRLTPLPPRSTGRRPERSQCAPVTNFRFVQGRVSGIRHLKSHYKTRQCSSAPRHGTTPTKPASNKRVPSGDGSSRLLCSVNRCTSVPASAFRPRRRR